MSIFAVTSSLVALAIANPVPNRKTDGIAIPLARHSSSLEFNKTIELDAITSHGISVREKILNGLENYERNTGTMHPFAVKRSDSESGLGRRGASVPLTPFRHLLWMAEISIGTPAKTFKVTIDTGAGDMWMLETGCAGISADRDLWNPESSGSAKDQEMPFYLQYADGSVIEADLFTDNVTIAGFTADPQIFGSAKSYTSLKPYEYPADGLLGLAFPSVAECGDNLFESLVKQNQLTDPILSFKLSSSDAEMYVGGTNSMLYNGEITYTPVTQRGFWQVSMDNLRLDGHIIFENVPVILDTGATHMYGDWNQVAELYRHLGGTLKEHRGFGLYSLPCNSFPALSLTFSGKTMQISPERFRLSPITTGSPDCFASIIALNQPVAYWTIGLAFLQGVYTVFDYSNLRVGFADLA